MRVPNNVSKNGAQPQHTSPAEPTQHDSAALQDERAKAPLRAQTGAEPVQAAVSTAARISVSVPTITACAIAATAIVAHFLLPVGFAQLAVTAAPLALPQVARFDNRRMQWHVYAGFLWLVLAWLELVQPMAGARSSVYHLVELTVLGVILVQLFEAARFMQHLSQRDPLTGLLNRRGFDELSAAELQRAARYDRPIAFALLDVDRFKAVNDQYGHAVGDRVLRIVSEELLNLRTSDLAVRLGGDEFGLLMPETDELGAEQLVSRVRQRIHTRMFEMGWPITISAGVATSERCRKRLPDLITEADSRMYACKMADRA